MQILVLVENEVVCFNRTKKRYCEQLKNNNDVPRFVTDEYFNGCSHGIKKSLHMLEKYRNRISLQFYVRGEKDFTYKMIYNSDSDFSFPQKSFVENYNSILSSLGDLVDKKLEN